MPHRSRSIRVVCPGCHQIVDERVNRCPQCGEPIAGYNLLGVTHFFGSRFRRGKLGRRNDRRPKLVYVIGSAIATLLSVILGVFFVTITIQRNPDRMIIGYAVLVLSVTTFVVFAIQFIRDLHRFRQAMRKRRASETPHR